MDGVNVIVPDEEYYELQNRIKELEGIIATQDKASRNQTKHMSELENTIATANDTIDELQDQKKELAGYVSKLLKKLREQSVQTPHDPISPKDPLEK